MKKIVLCIALAMGAASYAHAQNQFFGVDPDKFANLLVQSQKMPRDNAALIINQTMQVLSNNPKGYRKALDIAIQRLGDPTDSIHSEEEYIIVLTNATQSGVLSNSEKARPQALLESALKNRTGEKATDVEFVKADGKKGNLLNNDNVPTLVYFNDPDCDACAKVMENMAASASIKGAVEAGKLHVVAINPMDNEKLWKKKQFPSWITNGWDKAQSINEGGLYDLPTLPVFYLLAGDNTVLLKNEASFKRIEKAVTLVLASQGVDSNKLVDLLFIKR